MNIIVQFVNRKNAFTCLRNTKKLYKSSKQDYKKVFIVEKLYRSNKNIFNYLYKLKKENKIKNYGLLMAQSIFRKQMIMVKNSPPFCDSLSVSHIFSHILSKKCG